LAPAALALVIALVMALVIASACGPASYESGTLAHCPTMAPVAAALAAETGMHLELQPSAAKALERLEAGAVTAVLVGRRAYSDETKAGEMVLGTGHTLVSARGGTVQRSSLGRLTVHTAMGAAEAARLIPEAGRIVAGSAKAAHELAPDEALLIPWEAFTGRERLLVVAIGKEKDTRFRVPVLFSHDHSLLRRAARR